MIEIRRILYPTDFSPSAEHALPYAASFAKEYGAKLFVLHVVEDLTNVAYFEVFQTPLPANFLKDVEALAQKQMDELLKRDQLKGLDVQGVLRRGAPHVEILTAAVELQADLIVIATHGHSALQQVLFGSTAEKVVRKAPCPVLSIRHPDQKFVMPGEQAGKPDADSTDS